jgi:uncharacterized protein DUF5694
MLTIAIAASSQSKEHQSVERPEVLVLGTYHMSNPGHDMYNLQADDVLSPKRQEEIEQLAAVLKKFHPTKIAIEAEIDSERVTQKYSDYLAGKYTLTRNETDQIGFRLAKESGHKAIYPIDVDGDFPWQRVANYAKANGRADKLDAVSAGWGTMVKEQGDFLQSHTVLETLEFTNSDARVAKDVGLYFGTVPFGDPGDYAGPDLLTAWYQRNIHIYANIVKLIDSPNERILVVYGAGHLGWLWQDIASDPGVKLRKLAEFVQP